MTHSRIACWSADQLTALVTLLSTIVLSGLAGPQLSLNPSDVMDHYFFGGQLRGDTVPLAACNPAHDSHYLNCVMTDPEVASKALAPLLDQLTNGYHGIENTPVYLRPRDVSLLKPTVYFGNRTHAHAQNKIITMSLSM